MIKRIIFLFLAVVMSANLGFAKTPSTVNNENKTEDYCIGKSIKNDEYPEPDKIAPFKIEEPKMIIEGSVEKLVDITLSECIRLALGNNPKIRSAIEDVVAADARVGQAWSNYFPVLDWSTNMSKNRNLLFGDAIGNADATYNYYILGQISVSQLIYDFGVTQNQATIKKLDYKGKKESLTEVVNEVIRSTKNAYYNLLYAYDTLKVAEDNVKKYEIFYKQAKAFYEIGTNPKVDVTIAEVNLSKAKLQLIQSESYINIAIAKLNNTMGLPYITKFNVKERLSYQPLNITVDEAINVAKESRPDLKLAELRVQAANQTLKLAKKSYFPQLTASGNYAIGGSSFTSNYGYTAMGSLDFPLVNIMLINKQIKEAHALYDKETANIIVTRNDIYLEIQKAYYALIEKKSQIPVAFLAMKQAKENYQLSFGRYRVGEGSPTELKEAQVALMEAQLNYYKALYEYNTAKADLEKSVGKNLVSPESVINLAE